MVASVLGGVGLARAADDSTKPGGTATGGDAPASRDKREAARLHLAEGNRLFRATDFDGAAREYRAAYDLVPSGKLHFNIGLAEKMRGNPVEAARELDRFLAAEPAADAELRADATGYLEDLSGIVSSVQLQVNSASRVMAVTVDGAPIESPPPGCPLRLAPGRHEIVVRRDDSPPWGHTLDLVAGASLTLVPDLDMPLSAAARTDGAPLVAQGARASSGRPAAAPSGGALQASSSSTAPTPPRASPIYRRWWFWAAVAGVTGAGFAAAAVWAGRGSDNGAGPTCALPMNCLALMKGL